MVKQSITVEDLRKLRIDLSYKLNTALANLKWDRMKLAEQYGLHMQNSEYSKGRISQLIRVNKGEEENSQKLLDWMLEKIEEQKNMESRQW